MHHGHRPFFQAKSYCTFFFFFFDEGRTANDNKIQIHLDGNVIHDLESFYDEADRKLTVDFKSGHNLDAFNDLLRGGFGRFDYGQEIDLYWTQFKKSSATLPPNKLEVILEIIDESENVTFFPVDN